MMNGFNVVTMNGIACWGDDFGLKSGPLPIYLDVRNHLVQELSHMNGGRLSCMSLACRFFLNSVFSYNYATAHAVSLALNHVMKGERFWCENLDASEVRNEISALEPDERLERIDVSEYQPVHMPMEERAGRRLLRVATLNGFLLPRCLIKDVTVY